MRTLPSILIVAALLAAALPRGGGAAVRVALVPGALTVAPGDTFTLSLRVTEPGSAFNGYDAVVEYDPAVLAFLPLSPTSKQQGADMKAVCGNTWHFFTAAGDSLVISNVLLCPDTALTGPAELYNLRFRAASASAVTSVRLRRVQFYDEGLFVNPAVCSDATVHWGVLLDAPPPVAVGARLVARANPSRGEQWFDLSSPAAGEQRLEILDPAGRRVRSLDTGERGPGARSVRWDGRDDSGRRVPPGLYLVRFTVPGAVVRASVVRLP